MDLVFFHSFELKSSQWREGGYRRFFIFVETYLVYFDTLESHP
jgi:hypothetical protein